MASLSKFGAVTLTALSVLTGTLVSLSKPAVAGEVVLDDRCRPNQKLQSDGAFVNYQSAFTANRQSYWFSAARYLDGAVLLCISKPNFREAKPLSVSQLQNQFIHKIVKAPNSNAVFLVTVAEGNGGPVPLTDYRLNLSNPNKPVLTRLRQR
ncbi:MAG: hypothetical protein AB1589_32045 [Cyanobacteriota bacterium]